MSREAVFVVGEGTVTALAGGPLSMADLGTRTTKRASHVEWSDYEEMWLVTDAATLKTIFRHADYDVALEWERTEFNRQLAEAG